MSRRPLLPAAAAVKLTSMKRLLLLLIAISPHLSAQPTPAAVSVFDAYIASVESRLAQQHQSASTFLVPAASLAPAQLAVERLTPGSGQALPGALLHHWRATAFAPGATIADIERLLRDFDAYPQRFAPEVLRATVLSPAILSQPPPDRLEASMRVRQHHILTAVMDTTYAVAFGRLDPEHGFSSSRSLHIAEIADAGTASEHALSPGADHGFLWRQNTYWTYAQRDGGLYLQVESISLSRAIPRGLGWAVAPFVESIPRESLEFTLRSTCNALAAQPKGPTP